MSKLVRPDGKPISKGICPRCGSKRRIRTSGFGPEIYNCEDCGQELPSE